MAVLHLNIKAPYTSTADYFLFLIILTFTYIHKHLNLPVTYSKSDKEKCFSARLKFNYKYPEKHN